MSAAVTRVAVRSAVGDLAALLHALDAGRVAGGPAPWPLGGLPPTPVAVLPGLDRTGAPAERLLAEVVAALFGGPPPPGTGLVVGTASGNVCGPFERAHAAFLRGEGPPPSGPAFGRDGPAAALAPAFDGPTATLSVACASGALALLVADGWLRDGLCARVVVAGVDVLGPFVHAGFAGLGAVGRGDPRPFRLDRDGLRLGEGAGALLLEAAPAGPSLHRLGPSAESFASSAADPGAGRESGIGICELSGRAAEKSKGSGPPLAWLRGAATASDAWHPTAPDPAGAGAARALAAALEEAGLAPSDVDGLSVHGTATRANDAMEANALRRVFGDDVPPRWAVKGTLGHPMGAAGAIEAAVAVAALARGARPPALPDAPEDPGDPVGGLRTAPRGGPRVVATMSSAFGGVNAAAVFSAAPPPSAPAPRRVREGRSAALREPAPWPDAPPDVARASPYVRLGLATLRALGEPPEPDVALVLASRANCAGADREHHARLVAEGLARASRRAFVGTVPGAPIHEASRLWGLRGPLLTFVDGPERAREEAARLVRHGRAPAAIALALDPEAPAGEAWSFRAAP